MSYKVAISEDQRKIIAAALGYAVLIDEKWKHSEEARVMIEMLEELPQIEAAHPGILHGFAL